MAELVRVQNLKKSYRHMGRALDVLKGIDLSVDQGEVLAIVGKSGAGKSTLLYCIGTLDLPSSGVIHLAGHELTRLSPAKLAAVRNQTIGFVFQFHHLLPEFTALENVMMPGLIAGKSRSEMAARAKKLLEEVGLDSRSTHRPGELSGGEQQRVALARALVLEPKMILADEPTGNLDSATSEAIHHLFFDMNKRHGTTIIVVTHNVAFAQSMPRVVTMADGKIFADERIEPREMDAAPEIIVPVPSSSGGSPPSSSGGRPPSGPGGATPASSQAGLPSSRDDGLSTPSAKASTDKTTGDEPTARAELPIRRPPRLLLWRLVLGLALIVAGAQGAWLAVTNLRPTEVSCADWAQEPPRGEWLRLSDCMVDTDTILHDAWRHEGRRYYMPLLPRDAEKGTRAALVLVTRDLRLDYDNAREGWNGDSLVPLLQVEGMVKRGKGRDDSLARAVADKLQDQLADGYGLLEAGEVPRPWHALLAFALGLVVLGHLGVSMTRARLA
jgi:lipoprotein-releasing system ATP-binding protein